MVKRFSLSARLLWSAAVTTLVLLPLLFTSDYIWGAGMDLPLQHHPLREFAYQCLKSGEWPLWNPYSGSGLPYQTGFRTLAYPVHLLGLLMTTGTALKLSVLLHVFLGTFFMMSVADILGFSPPGAVAAGATFGCSGFMLGRVYAGHIDWVEPVAYAPFILWTFLLAFRRPGVGWTVLAGASIAWMGLAGHYQPIYITLVGVLGMLTLLCLTGSRFSSPPLDWKERWRSDCVNRQPTREQWEVSDFTVPRKQRLRDLGHLLQRVTIAGALSAGATMFRLLPSAQSALHSNRLVAPETTGDSTLPLSHFVSYIIPHFFEGTSTVLVWGRWPSWETQGYLGVVLLVLICLAFLTRRECWLVPGSFVLFGLAVSAGDAFFLYPLWHSVDPLLQNFSAPARFELVTLLFGCWLGALGVETLGSDRFAIRRAVVACLPLLVIVVGLSLWLARMDSDTLSWGRFVQPIASSEGWRYLLEQHSDNLPSLARTNLERSLIPVFFVFLSLLCLRLKQQLRAPTLVALVVLDLVLFARPYLKTAPPEAFELSPELKSILSPVPAGTRFQWSPGMLLHNRLAAQHLSDLSCSDYFADRTYVKATNLHNGLPIDQPANVVVHRLHGVFPSLQGAGVILSSKPLQEPALSLLGEVNGVHCYQNSEALPRAFMSDHQLQGDVSTVLREASKNLENLCRPEEARLVKLTANSVEVEANPKKPGTLVLTDAPWPGWQVTVDGKKEELLVLNAGLHRGVRLSPGKHRVRFLYWPTSLTVGLSLSALSLIAFLALLAPWRRSLAEDVSQPNTGPAPAKQQAVQRDQRIGEKQ
jgi:hypothetical protein